MSLGKRLRKIAHKVEHVAVKAATPGLSAKKEKRLEHTIDVAHNLEGKVARASISPTKQHVTALKTEAKVVTRNLARSGAKPVIYATGAITAVASYVGTPVAGAAVGAALSSANYYVGSTAARAKGKHGQAARHAGRVERKKSINAALIGMSIGGAAAGIGAAVAGSAQAAGVGSGAAAIVGQGNVGTIGAIGSVAIGAAQKIVPAVIAKTQGPSTSSGAISVTSGGGQASESSSQASQASVTKKDWELIALGAAALIAAAAA